MHFSNGRQKNRHPPLAQTQSNGTFVPGTGVYGIPVFHILFEAMKRMWGFPRLIGGVQNFIPLQALSLGADMSNIGKSLVF